MHRYLNVPGLGDSGHDHWQSIWEAQHPKQFERIIQEDWEHPNCTPWINNIDQQVSRFSCEDVVLIGHSVGCAAIIQWHAKFQKKIRGVLLVAPSDVEAPGYPNYIKGFSPLPLAPLPFPSIVVASTNDHVVTLQRASIFANHWGSEFVILENAGHIEGKNGYGTWGQGLDLLNKILSAKN